MFPTMAAINPFTPVTPPPENSTFGHKPVPLQPPLQALQPPTMTGFDMPLPTPADFISKPERQQQSSQTLTQTQAHSLACGPSAVLQPPPQADPPPPPPPPPATSASSQQPQAQTQTRSTQTQTQAQTQTQTQSQAHAPASSHAQAQAQAQASPVPFPMDSKEIAMVTRIAAFYQQRCQAITNYQQQRCQAWASSYRQKCHETMQAAMLVVAWYVRDRIRRRRRKQKDKFRRGLRERSTRARTGAGVGGAGGGPVPAGGVTKGERVRRWVMQVPDSVLPADALSMDRAADKDEVGFSLDEEAPPDRDTKLFQMADNLIRSQYRNVEVPLMGVLSFEESETESDDGSDRECPRCMGRLSDVEVAGDPPDQFIEEDDGVGEDPMGEEEYDEYEDEDELYEDDYMDDIEEGEEEEEEAESQLVHGAGTGTGKSSAENDGSFGVLI